MTCNELKEKIICSSEGTAACLHSTLRSEPIKTSLLCKLKIFSLYTLNKTKHYGKNNLVIIFSTYIHTYIHKLFVKAGQFAAT